MDVMMERCLQVKFESMKSLLSIRNLEEMFLILIRMRHNVYLVGYPTCQFLPMTR